MREDVFKSLLAFEAKGEELEPEDARLLKFLLR